MMGALAVGLAAVASTAWLRAASKEGEPESAVQASIAVLPFVNASRDQQEAAIVDGLSEEIITALWRIPDLRVIARSSVLAFGGSDAGVRDIGDSLGVRHLLEGSVQRSGSRMRVQVRLVDARDRSTRWSESYDLPREDMVAVQSEIAASVARELKLRVVPGTSPAPRRASTGNVAAYELYLRGRDPARLRSPADSGPREGLALLQQAVALDSGFAAAYAAMPSMSFSLAGQARSVEQLPELRRLALDAARMWVSLDSALPEAHVALSVALMTGRADLSAAEAALRRALELGERPANRR